jgi:ubiquinone/menaquinone biosynthesis C-methylase UbiE
VGSSPAGCRSCARTRLSREFPEIYERILVPCLFRPWALDLLERVPLAQDDRVLDVACGTGIVARLAREQLGAGSQIAGVDVNPEMIAATRSRAPDISWHLGDAIALPFEDESFDVIFCQQGLQFFPDRAAAVLEMRRVLAEGGRVALSTWRTLHENPLFQGLNSAAARQFAHLLDRRFALSDERTICTLLAEQGFTDVTPRIVEKMLLFPDVESFLLLNLWALVADLFEKPEDERIQILAHLRENAAETLHRFECGAGLRHPMRANVVTARSA